MPRLSVFLVRASLIHLGIGFLFGAFILAHKGTATMPWAWQLFQPHHEIMIFGWTIQFVMGISFYILPRFSQRVHRYGVVRLGWASFWLLNMGVSLVVLASLLNQEVGILVGRVLSLLAVILYVVMIWSRIKPIAAYPISRPNKEPDT